MRRGYFEEYPESSEMTWLERCEECDHVFGAFGTARSEGLLNLRDSWHIKRIDLDKATSEVEDRLFVEVQKKLLTWRISATRRG